MSGAMEEFYPPTINRTLVMVMAKEPFINWETEVFPTLKPVSADKDDQNSYLIKESDMVVTLKIALKDDWSFIFEHELNGICTDENTWPKNRTWELFTEWFDVKMSTMVLDMVNAPVMREEF